MPYFALPAYTKKSLKWLDFKDLRSFAKLFGGADGYGTEEAAPEAFEAEAAGEPNGPDKADGTEVADETFEVNDAGAEEPDDADDAEPLPKVGSREGALLFALAEAFDIEASELRVIVGERGDGTSTEQERQLAGQQLARTLQRLFGEQTPAEAPSPEA